MKNPQSVTLSILLGLAIGMVSVSHAGEMQSLRTMQGIHATPLSSNAMAATKGKAVMNLSDFLAQATKVNLGAGVYVWGYSSNGNTFGVTATWNTGSTSGTGSAVFP